jgi:hypothetical protein
MGPRMWATLGNILKSSAIFSFLGVGLLGYRSIQLYQSGAPRDLIWPLAGLAVVSFLFSVLLWNLKGPLVSGNFIARFFVGLYFLMGVIGSLGFNLLIIGVFYLFTGEPSTYETERQGKNAQPQYSPPKNFHATAAVGPSGAMAYGGEHRDGTVEIIDSWTPVQVMGKKNGLVEVVAATGQRGWIDSRTLTEVAA